MKVSAYKLGHLSVIVALSMAMTHCDKTSFDKGAVPTGSAAVVQTPASNDREVEENDTDAAVASEPVAVGGAFLSCMHVAAQSNTELEAVQCEFSSKDLESGRAQDIRYGFSTGSNREQASAIKPAREDFVNDGERQVWLWNFYFVKSEIREAWLFVDIEDRARALDATIKADIAIPVVAPVPTPGPTPTAAPAALPAPTLITFNSGAQKLGDDGAGVGVEAACASIDTVNISIARSRRYTLTLTAETSLNIVFSNLCGVGTGQTNTAGSFTTASLRNASNTAVFQFNLATGARLTYVSSRIPPGTYSFVVTPASRNGALNDFVYSNLMIEGAGIAIK